MKPEIPKETAFSINQQVVYPLQGVGKIVSIKERLFKNTPVLYYIIYLAVTDMTIMVPVNKAKELGIRAVASKETSLAALQFLSEEYEPVTIDWKMRYQMNLDLLKSGGIMDFAMVVRALYHRSKIKELPILERKLFDEGLSILVDETSFSLEMSKGEAEQLIFSKLETS